MQRFTDGTMYKNGNGYVWEHHGCFVWNMYFDASGVYIGQEQTDMDGPGNLFLSPEMINGVPCVNGKPVAPLTEEDMLSAE